MRTTALQRSEKAKSQMRSNHRDVSLEPIFANLESIPAYSINSAPEDGTWVFVYGVASTSTKASDDVPPSWHRAYWEEGDDDEPRHRSKGVWCGEDEIIILNVVAWIPIPPPPRFPPISWQGAKLTSPRRGEHAWLAE